LFCELEDAPRVPGEVRVVSLDAIRFVETRTLSNMFEIKNWFGELCRSGCGRRRVPSGSGFASKEQPPSCHDPRGSQNHYGRIRVLQWMIAESLLPSSENCGQIDALIKRSDVGVNASGDLDSQKWAHCLDSLTNIILHQTESSHQVRKPILEISFDKE
jgi:hypothetical protein